MEKYEKEKHSRRLRGKSKEEVSGRSHRILGKVRHHTLGRISKLILSTTGRAAPYHTTQYHTA